jgi:hypothetical protein
MINDHQYPCSTESIASTFKQSKRRASTATLPVSESSLYRYLLIHVAPRGGLVVRTHALETWLQPVRHALRPHTQRKYNALHAHYRRCPAGINATAWLDFWLHHPCSPREMLEWLPAHEVIYTAFNLHGQQENIRTTTYALNVSITTDLPRTCPPRHKLSNLRAHNLFNPWHTLYQPSQQSLSSHSLCHI